MSNPIRVFLVDDHTVVRSGLRLLLDGQADLMVIGEAPTGAEAVEQANQLHPDVVVMDITLPDFDGVEATRRLRALWPTARILALTMHDEDAYLVAFLEAGGMGYVGKSAADRDLVNAIRTVARGEVFLQPSGVQAIVREHRHAGGAQRVVGPDVLSERERQVLELTAKGFTSREIGEQLAVSPRTVETYRERIMGKLDLTHRSELVEYALKFRLLG
ncbi:MAG: response regulator transcription factor [Anaerolineae bacterium]|nr:response regulator transcription factor [Anaerolineae bacterium]